MSNDLRKYVSLVLEKIRSKPVDNVGTFEWNKFKTLSYPRNVSYAEIRLQKLGSGSSRAVYVLTSNKVLKIAEDQYEIDKGNEIGRAQNKAEVEYSKKSGVGNFIAKVYDAAPDYSWIVSEVVREFEDEGDMLRYINVDKIIPTKITTPTSFKSYLVSDETEIDIPGHYVEHLSGNKSAIRRESDNKGISIIRTVDKNSLSKEDLYDLFDEIMTTGWNNGSKNIDEYVYYTSDHGKKLKIFMDSLKQLNETSELKWDDVNNTEHWGYTADGRVVILDYGLTEEIWSKHY